MRPTLLEIRTIAPWHILIVAGILTGAAVVVVWRERRLARIEPHAFTKSLVTAVAVALILAFILYLVTRFIHPLRVRSYGVMLMLAFAAGIAIAVARARLYNIQPNDIVDLSLFVLLGSIVGSRAMYIILNWKREFAQDPTSVFNIWEGGLSFHGGLIGGVLAGVFFCRRRQIRPTLAIDLVAPSVAFGYAIARVGCFLNGCCGGGPTRLPWGVDFIQDPVIGPVHPTQLYSSISHILIGALLLWVAKRVRVPGHLGLWFLVLSSAARIGDEITRRGYSAQVFSWFPALTQAQVASVAIILASSALLLWTRSRVGYPLPLPQQADTVGEPPSARRRVRAGKKRRR